MMSNILTIIYLVVIEGLLSFDNALALAALVKKRLSDPEDQKHALRWGILGAYIFRIGVIFAGVWLMSHVWVKLVAGGYLVILAVTELFFANKDGSDLEGFTFKGLSPLWSTIVSVEIMDIMFSLDSIGVALAVSNKTWVLIAGAVLGILMMRVAAGVFIKLIERYPILEKTAFVLVGIAGLNVMLKVAHWDIPEAPFFGLLATIFVGSIAYSEAVKEA